MGKLGSAFVEIAADLKKLQEGFKAAKTETNVFLKDINKKLSVLDISPIVKNISAIGFKIAAITAPLTATGGAIYAISQKTANAAAWLDSMSQKTGIAVNELYAMKKIAESTNMGIAQLSDGLRTLSKNLTLARSATDDTKGAMGDLRRMFAKLGIDINKPLLEVMKDLGRVFEKVEDGEAKLTLSMKLFGEMAGQDMIPTLKELNKQGLNISDTFGVKSVSAAKEFNSNITKIKQNIAELTYSIGNKLIPVVNNFFDIFKDENVFVGFARRFARDPSFGVTQQSRLPGISGATSIKDLPFVFGGQAQKERLPSGLFKETLQTTEAEEKRTAKAIADAYKDMYDVLKYDAERYYDFRLEALEKQREREIEVTGDMTLAWQAYHARLRELENERIMQTGSAMEGLKLFFDNESRSAQSWASEVVSGMESLKDSLKNVTASIARDTTSIGGFFVNMANTILDAMARIGSNMLINSLFSMAGGLFSTTAMPTSVGTMGGTSWGGNLGFSGTSSIPLVGAMSSSSMSSKSSGDTIIYNVQATDVDSFRKLLKKSSGTINEITISGKRKSRNFEKNLR